MVTADGGWRGGHAVELKRAVDKALAEGCETVQQRHRVPPHRRRVRDARRPRSSGGTSSSRIRATECEPEWVNAEHPLFLLYTSGSTGKPKGIQHSSGGYLLGAKLTTRWTFDLKDSDVFWCTADVGWVTGHTYVAYGPLAAGRDRAHVRGRADISRRRPLLEDLRDPRREHFLHRADRDPRADEARRRAFPRKYDLTQLRLLGSVGEPINPEAWMWYHRVIGRERCPIVDTWWQTETGAIMMTPVPGVTPTKPGSCTRPLPGVFADIVDDEGRAA